MKTSLLSPRALAFGLALLLGALATADLAGAFAGPCGELREELARAEDVRQRGEAQDERLRQIQERLQAKDALTEDLIAGRLTLSVAARRVRDLPGETPGWIQLIAEDQGASEDETICLHLIACVEEALHDQEVKRSEVIARLRAELEAHLRQQGPVALTAAPAARPG
jgi:hypothetical protein